MLESDADFDVFAAMGPGAADKAVRDAIQLCWMTLPKDRRSLPELEATVRRLVDRAFRDMQEDNKSHSGG